MYPAHCTRPAPNIADIDGSEMIAAGRRCSIPNSAHDPIAVTKTNPYSGHRGTWYLPIAQRGVTDFVQYYVQIVQFGMKKPGVAIWCLKNMLNGPVRNSRLEIKSHLQVGREIDDGAVVQNKLPYAWS